MTDLVQIAMIGLVVLCAILIGINVIYRAQHTDYCSLKIGDFVTAIPCDKYYENEITLNIDGSDFHFTRWFEERKV